MSGFKRHIKYITVFQGKYFLYALLFGLLLGIMRFIIADTADNSVNAIHEINTIIITIIILMPGNLTMRYLQYQADLCLQLGCTRKNIYWGTYIIILELVAETYIFQLLLTMINPIFGTDTGLMNSYGNIFVYLISILFMINMGLINALMSRRFGRKSLYLTMIIFYVIFIAAIMNEDVISWITGPYAAPIIILSMLILLVILLAIPVRRSIEHIVIKA